jgi:hypothetical protein
MRIVADARRKIPRNAILTVKLCFEALKGEGGAVIPKCKWETKPSPVQPSSNSKPVWLQKPALE